MTCLALNLVVGLRLSWSVRLEVEKSADRGFRSWAWFRSYMLLLGPLSLGVVVFRELGR